MPITTRISPSYAGRMIFIAVLCLVFSVWGAYDLWVKIPAQERAFEAYTAAIQTRDELDRKKTSRRLTLEDEQAYAAATQTITTLTPNGAAPVRPSKFNRLTQWFYISCILAVPYFIMLYRKASGQKYQLDEDGTLHFAGDATHGSGAWTADEIADIDMARWMAKSIAWVVHRDGRRLMLDAYLHKDLHLIVGAIASRLMPDKWDADAKAVKKAEAEIDTVQQGS